VRKKKLVRDEHAIRQSLGRTADQRSRLVSQTSQTPVWVNISPQPLYPHHQNIPKTWPDQHFLVPRALPSHTVPSSSILVQPPCFLVAHPTTTSFFFLANRRLPWPIDRRPHGNWLMDWLETWTLTRLRPIHASSTTNTPFVPRYVSQIHFLHACACSSSIHRGVCLSSTALCPHSFNKKPSHPQGYRKTDMTWD